jgi:hypothetical protein
MWPYAARHPVMPIAHNAEYQTSPAMEKISPMLLTLGMGAEHKWC